MIEEMALNFDTEFHLPCATSASLASPGTETVAASGHTDAEPPPLSHRPSMRQLLRLPRLDSSDAFPSDHSSLYDAASFTTSRQASSSQTDPGREHDGHRSDGSDVDAQYTSPHLINRSIGTKLSTIAEQKSIQTLKTIPSNLTFQRRTVTLQPTATRALEEGHHSQKRKRPFSADERLFKYLNCDGGASRGSTESSSVDCQIQRHELSPARPLHNPPHREPTPAGLPRWPGEADVQPEEVSTLFSRSRPSISQISQYLRGQSSARGIRLRDILHPRPRISLPAGRQIPTGRRFWRPPASAHATHRYDNLQSHPFASAPTADLPSQTPVWNNLFQCRQCPEAWNFQGRQEFLLHMQAMHPSRDLRCARNTSVYNGKKTSRTTSPSQRSLRYAQGHPVPVSPLRASAKACQRSSTMPEGLRTPTTELHMPPLQSAGGESSTIRTLDMLQSFPAPPPLEYHVDAPPAPPKRPAWSLFPKSLSQSSLRASQMKPLPPRPQSLRRFRRSDSVSDNTDCARSAIRGESSARYRVSGAPLYDGDMASLRSFDRRQDRREPSTDESMRVAPPSLGTRALRSLSPVRSSGGGGRGLSHERSGDQQRSDSNEHTRYVAPSDNSNRRQLVQDSFTTVVQPDPGPVHHQGEENFIPTTPAAVENVPGKVCKHKLAKFKAQGGISAPQSVHPAVQFDGTSYPPPPSQTTLLEIPPIAIQRTSDLGSSQITAAPVSDSISPATPRHRTLSAPVGFDHQPPGRQLTTTTTFVTAPSGSTTFNVSPNLHHATTLESRASMETTSTLPGRA